MALSPDERRARNLESAKRWAAANPDRKKVNDSNRNKKRKHQTNLAWAARNPEKLKVARKAWVENNRESVRQISTRWRRRNLEKDAAKASKRRGSKKAVQENFTDAQRSRVKNQFDNRCFRCHTESNLHIDHHLPLALGNPLAYGNAVVLCGTCNPQKGTKHPMNFYTPHQLQTLDRLLAEQREWSCE